MTPFSPAQTPKTLALPRNARQLEARGCPAAGRFRLLIVLKK
jgi:hypothetical protein